MSSSSRRSSRAQGYGSDRRYDEGLQEMARPNSLIKRHGTRIATYTVVGGVLLLGATNLSLAVRNSSLNDRLEATLETQYNPSYRVRFADLGGDVVRSWYGSGVAPVSLADGLTWPGANPAGGTSVVPATTTTTAADPAPGTTLDLGDVAFVRGEQVEVPGGNGYVREILTYSGTVNSVPYDVTITLGIPDVEDYTTRPVLLSEPVITAAAPRGTSDLSSRPEGSDGGVSDEATAQLASWAEAWTEDDRAAIKQVTQDDSSVTYTGLPGGWTYVPDSLSVSWSLVVDEGTAAEVSWLMKVPDTTVPGVDGAGPTTVVGPTQTQRMDVLIDRIETGLPSVVAWGPVGSYESLLPGEDAVDEEAAEDLVPEVEPTTEPGVAPVENEEVAP